MLGTRLIGGVMEHAGPSACSEPKDSASDTYNSKFFKMKHELELEHSSFNFGMIKSAKVMTIDDVCITSSRHL